MAQLDGYFSDPNPGTLICVLSGTFGQGTYRDAGFPGTTGGIANLLLGCHVGPYELQPIDRYVPTSVAHFDYPGGNASWHYYTSTIAYQDPTSGLWSYGFAPISLSLLLQKK